MDVKQFSSFYFVAPMMYKSFIVLLFLLDIQNCLASAVTLEAQRTAFLHTEKLLDKGASKAVVENLQGLRGYPLYPYLMFRWLKGNLHLTEQIETFLADYPDSRFAALLREEWLAYLADHQQWRVFLEHYQNSGNLNLDCSHHWALQQTGQQRQALTGAGKLWLNSQQPWPRQCQPLFTAFLRSDSFTEDLLWQKFALDLQHRDISSAKNLRELMTPEDRKISDFWLRIDREPALVNDYATWDPDMHQAGRIFSHGIRRLARKNLEQAITLWDSGKHSFHLTHFQIDQLDKELAIKLVQGRNKSAFERFRRLFNNDQEIREWRVRAALLEQNWQHVDEALQRLTSQEKQLPKWQYWQARAYWQLGNRQQAQKIFQRLARSSSFYGFVAADYIGEHYQIGAAPLHRERLKLTRFRESNAFKAILEFQHFGRHEQARQQWRFAIQRLNHWQLPAAAYIAQEMGWKRLAMATLIQAELRDDVISRFPIAYREKVLKHAKRSNLDPAIVFGLIRRESGFDEAALSPVGARGLMQIMPQTGRQIAKNLREPWLSANALFDPERNLKYGTYYYRQMMNRFDGHFVLAAAAYNAGPHRVKRWLPDGRALPADIWIEMIPFDETRKYVAAVLTYAMIYQQRLHRNTLKLLDLLGKVPPGKT